MFLRAQHFQQQDRYLEHLLQARTAPLRPHPWGLTELSIDRDLLAAGRSRSPPRLGRARGRHPVRDPRPAPTSRCRSTCRRAPATRWCTWRLPLRQAGQSRRSPATEGPDECAPAMGCGFRGLRHPFRQHACPAELQVGRPRLRYLLETEELRRLSPASASPAITEVQAGPPGGARRPLHPALPADLGRAAAGQPVAELVGMLGQRGEALAARLAQPGSRGVADVADFLLLQAVNRWQPLMAHWADAGNVHPEGSLRRPGAGGRRARHLHRIRPARPAPIPAYRHDDLQRSFAPVIADLRRSLSAVLEPDAVSIPLQEPRHGVRVGPITDRNLLRAGSASCWSVQADMPAEQLRRAVPEQGQGRRGRAHPRAGQRRAARHRGAAAAGRAAADPVPCRRRPISSSIAAARIGSRCRIRAASPSMCPANSRTWSMELWAIRGQPRATIPSPNRMTNDRTVSARPDPRPHACRAAACPAAPPPARRSSRTAAPAAAPSPRAWPARPMRCPRSARRRWPRPRRRCSTCSPASAPAAQAAHVGNRDELRERAVRALQAFEAECRAAQMPADEHARRALRAVRRARRYGAGHALGPAERLGRPFADLDLPPGRAQRRALLRPARPACSRSPAATARRSRSATCAWRSGCRAATGSTARGSGRARPHARGALPAASSRQRGGLGARAVAALARRRCAASRAGAQLPLWVPPRLARARPCSASATSYASSWANSNGRRRQLRLARLPPASRRPSSAPPRGRAAAAAAGAGRRTRCPSLRALPGAGDRRRAGRRSRATRGAIDPDHGARHVRLRQRRCCSRVSCHCSPASARPCETSPGTSPCSAIPTTSRSARCAFPPTSTCPRRAPSGAGRSSPAPSATADRFSFGGPRRHRADRAERRRPRAARRTGASSRRAPEGRR